MTQLENAEILRLPDKFKPMKASSYFWYSILYMLPIIGLISLIVCACSDKNINRRSFARGIIISMVVGLVLCIAIAAAAVALIMSGVITAEMLEAFGIVLPAM